MGPILIAADDSKRRGRLGSTLLTAGYRIIESANGYHTIDLLRRRSDIALALIELDMPDISGTDFVANIRALGVRTALIVLVDSEENKKLYQAMDSGANDFLIYPVLPLRLMVSVGYWMQRSLLTQRMDFLSRQHKNPSAFKRLVCKSEAMQALIRQSEIVGKLNKTVLITGETATGKIELANFLHYQNPKTANRGPFVPMRCCYYQKDTFAAQNWLKELEEKLQEAEGGTLFLCHVDLLEMDQQLQLLQILERLDKESRGGESEKKVHIMAMASQPLGDLVEEGAFLFGLFKKLSEFELKMPPLRHRREDISDLVHSILTEIMIETGYSKIDGISGGAMAMLLQHDWPGNFVELENCLFRAVLLSEGPLLQVQDFPQLIQQGEEKKEEEMTMPQVFFDASGHMRPLSMIEKHIIAEAMKRYRGKISEVARRLKIGRSTLYRKLEEYDFSIKHKG